MRKSLLLIAAVLTAGIARSVFAADAHRPSPRVFFLIGEDEYHTRDTLPAFAKAELEPRGIQCAFSILPSDESNDFPNVDALKDADVLFVSVRRHTPPTAQMDLIRAHVAAGKPVLGIRTASHAFALRGKDAKAPKGHAAWPEFDHAVLGGDYHDHYGKGIPTFAKIVPEAAAHPLLAGIGPEEFGVPSHLYKNPDLAPSVTRLMTARMEGRSEVEPVAWVNTARNRVFYTSLGSPEDFQVPQFRRLLLNAVCWAAGLPVTATTAPRSSPAGMPALPGAAGLPATTITTPAPGVAAPENTSRGTAAQTEALSPAESAKLFDVAGDLAFKQLLAEPVIQKPVFLNFDERGRMWVVEYRQYPAPAGLKMLSHDSFWRAIYDRVPPPPPNQFKGADRITIHESTRGDGVFDKHVTFLDGLNICTAVERGRGGVWVLNPPYLLFYRCKDGSDAPEGEPVAHLAGFGLEDTHSVANSLRWGPDGWLYGAHGSTVTSAIVRPGIDHEPCARMVGQGIWRYHPESQRFEVFSEGGGNTFGVEMDEKGRIFSGHNGGDTRGFYYMQGAYLRKGFDKHGPLSNPYAFGYFDAMPHAKVERFTHNFIIYEGNALPARHAGKLFGVEPLQGRIVESEITSEGSAFRTRDLERPVISRDPWFRPVDIKLGPDGAIYICDWYDRQIAHFRSYQGQMDGSKGRVYRLESAEAKTAPLPDLGKMESLELVGMLDDKNKWVRQTALRLLGDRRDASLRPVLSKALDAADGQRALELLWALNLSGGLDESAVLRCLGHGDPFVRLWTARLACDANAVSTPVGEKLAQAAAREASVEARAQLACSAKRLPAKEDFAIVRALLGHDEDAADPRLPLLLWWAIEAKAESDRDDVLTLFREPALWERPIVKAHLLERVMRRYAQTGARKDLLTCAQLLELAPAPEHSAKLMVGFEAAFKGRPLAGLPDELVQAMRRHHVGSVALALRQGEPGAIQAAIKTLGDSHAPAQKKLEYIAILGEVKAPESVPALLEIVRDSREPALSKAALTSLAIYDEPRIGEEVVALWPSLGKEALPVAQNLLSNRAGWSSALVGAVESGRIPRTSIPLEVVRKMKTFSEQDLPGRIAKLWGQAGRATTAEMDEKISRLTTVLQEGNGDVYQGRTLFLGTCASCHTLHGQGGQVGPDLTTFKRDDIEHLMLSIVNPSAEIREGYENFMLKTKDGRLVNGFLVEQDPQVVVLRSLDGQNLSLPRSEIAEMTTSGVSLMPEALLDPLSDQQVRDLFAYLRTSQPVVAKP